MKKSLWVLFSVAASLSGMVDAKPLKVPAAVVEDGYGDAASAFLEKHPDVEKCADKRVDDTNTGRRQQGLDEHTTSAEYGEFIATCAKNPVGAARQVTVVVAPHSIEASESGDGYSFKSTSGQDYYVTYNSTVKIPGAELMTDKNKTSFCLTLDKDDGIASISRGVCK